MTRNCLNCGSPGYVNPFDLPELRCAKCGEQLAVRMVNKDYWYKCGRCGDEWSLGRMLPDWSDLFPHSGIAAPGDPGWTSSHARPPGDEAK